MLHVRERWTLRVAGFLPRGMIVGKMPSKVVFDGAEPNGDDDEPQRKYAIIAIQEKVN
jgi:hypothetical protein